MKKKKGESGFALLLVFAMAATIALLAYIELPRFAFERQRTKEDMLIERGEEYKRAIQLYFRKFKTYPTSLDSLENTNNLRFLRRRYTDPLTGKDDWRLIHIGPGGVFTDSLTNKPKGNQQQPESQNNFITEGPSLASPDSSTSDQQVNPALRRRPSDGQQAPNSNPNAPVSQTPADPNSPGPTAAQLGLGQSSNGPPPPPGQPQTPGTPGAPNTPVSGLSGIPGLPGVPTDPNSQQTGTTTPTDPNAPGGQQGLNPNQLGSNSAADLIRGLLTQPRSMPTGQPMGGTGVGQIAAGSIAGVASKVERRGIKIYHERDKYNEWEFIYDFSKDRTGMGRMAGMMGAGQGQQPGQIQPGQQPGSTPGFGGQSPFGGQSGFGFGGNQQPQPSGSGPGISPAPLPPTTTSPQQ